jgi:hypothetical protein
MAPPGMGTPGAGGTPGGEIKPPAGITICGGAAPGAVMPICRIMLGELICTPFIGMLSIIIRLAWYELAGGA